MTPAIALPPRIGEPFEVAGRRDLLTVQHIETLRTDGHQSEYVVRSLSGARWTLTPRPNQSQLVRFDGRPLPADPDADYP